MTESLFEVEYKSGEFVLKFRPGRLRVTPEATVDHLKAANKEVLLAMRGLLDRAIERMEPQQKPPGRKRTRVEVKEEQAPS